MFLDENAQNQDMAKAKCISCGVFLRLLMLILITFVNKRFVSILCIVCDKNEYF